MLLYGATELTSLPNKILFARLSRRGRPIFAAGGWTSVLKFHRTCGALGVYGGSAGRWAVVARAGVQGPPAMPWVSVMCYMCTLACECPCSSGEGTGEGLVSGVEDKAGKEGSMRVLVRRLLQSLAERQLWQVRLLPRQRVSHALSRGARAAARCVWRDGARGCSAQTHRRQTQSGSVFDNDLKVQVQALTFFDGQCHAMVNHAPGTAKRRSLSRRSTPPAASWRVQKPSPARPPSSSSQAAS